MTQVRVHKPRPRRRVERVPDAEELRAARKRARGQRRSSAKIYDGLGLPSWRE